MLYLAGIGFGLAAGFAIRGRLSSLGTNVRLRWVLVLYAALGGQLLIGFADASWLTDDVQFAILLGSYGVLVAWLGIQVAAHRSWLRWSFLAVAAGTSLNLFAIAPNGGIPVSEHAIRKAGAEVPSGELNRFAVKHVLAGPGTRFNMLGDVIPLKPLGDVISIGDIFIGLGVASAIAAGMRMKPEPVPQEAPVEQEQQPMPKPVAAARGGVLDREQTVGEFVAQFASGYALGKAYEPMSESERHPADSRVVLSQAMSITDANLAGNVHGGVIMKLVDTAAGLAAIKHAHGRVVTVSMDEMSFLEPVFLTDVVTLYAQVNDVGRTSMEVGVRVEAENTVTGERRHVSSAYLVFVALDADGKPRPVPSLVAQSEEERRRMEDAKIRRRHRIARKEALMARRSAQTDPKNDEPDPPAAPEPPRAATFGYEAPPASNGPADPPTQQTAPFTFGSTDG